MSLTKARSTKRLGAANEVILSSLALPQGAGTTIYDGALVALSGGYLIPFTTGAGLTAIGRAAIQTGQPMVAVNNGDNTVRVEQGVFPYLMGASTDALAVTDVGRTVYGSDDQTINRTDGGGTRGAVGKLVGIKSTTEVFVSVGLQFSVSNDSNPEEIAANATLSVLRRTSRLTISGTKAYALPDGVRPGQRKTLFVVSAGSTPSGVVTPTHASGFTTITFGAGSANASVELEWDDSLGTPAWKVVGLITVGTVTIA